MMRVALVGSPEACARLRSEVEGTFAIVGVFRDLASARAGALDADAFLVANGGDDGSEEAAYVEPLTDREIEVLGLLAEGLSNKGIAARLGISDQTVKFHVASISGKLGTHTRTETVRRAVRRGLISL
ncbi:MAG TPA: response regulator transcription factor [Vicinamibacterales bacterium]|nr:response regulator transcription factor [Vicinamibacterales bacterium]